MLLKVTDEKGHKPVRVKDICAFPPTPSKLGGIFIELHWKSFALKIVLLLRPLLRKPSHISILARHPLPACCWHID